MYNGHTRQVDIYVQWLYWAGGYLCTTIALGRWIFMYNSHTGRIDKSSFLKKW